MIPAQRWRRVAFGLVVLAEAAVVLVVGVQSADVLLLVAPLLLALTTRAVFVPGGWAPHGIVLTEVGGYAFASSAPQTGLDWAMAVLVALAVLVTHLSLSLLAAWPVRAPLPAPTARRTTNTGLALSGLTVTAGGVGALASASPTTWAAWLVPAALAALAALAWALRASFRPAGVRR